MTQFCSACGYRTGGTGFCANCGARQTTNSSPGAGQGEWSASHTSDPVFDRRASANPHSAQNAFHELKLIGFGTLLPYKDWLRDKPWNLLWVRWLIGIALFPLFLVFLASTGNFEFQSTAFLFGAYFALMWAAVLYFMLRPKLLFLRIAQVWLFTMVVGIALVLIIQRFPLISALYSATHSASILGRFIGFVLGVGIVEELTKALPVWWLYVHKRNGDSLSTIVFLGCISGLAFGVAEAVNYSISYALGLAHGHLGFGAYLTAQFTRLITLPLLHALWSGVFAYFIALASINRHVGNGLLLAGLLAAAVLHGLYDIFSSTIIGVLIAVFSILCFVSYYRSGETLQAKISGLQGGSRQPKEGAVY